MLKNKCCLYVIISIRFFSIAICNLLIEFPSYNRCKARLVLSNISVWIEWIFFCPNCVYIAILHGADIRRWCGPTMAERFLNTDRKLYPITYSKANVDGFKGTPENRTHLDWTKENQATVLSRTSAPPKAHSQHTLDLSIAFRNVSYTDAQNTRRPVTSWITRFSNWN